NGSDRMDLGGLAEELELEPLESDAAEGLFIALATLDEHKLQSRDREHIKKICTLMRCLPLAIRLAARRKAAGESLPRLLQRLQQAPETLLGSGDSGVAPIFVANYTSLQQEPTAFQSLVRLAAFAAHEASESAVFAGLTDTEIFRTSDLLRDHFLVAEVVQGRLALHPLLGMLVKHKAPRELVEEQSYITQWLIDYAARYEHDYATLACEHANLLGLLASF